MQIDFQMKFSVNVNLIVRFAGWQHKPNAFCEFHLCKSFAKQNVMRFGTAYSSVRIDEIASKSFTFDSNNFQLTDEILNLENAGIGFRIRIPHSISNRVWKLLFTARNMLGFVCVLIFERIWRILLKTWWRYQNRC